MRKRGSHDAGSSGGAGRIQHQPVTVDHGVHHHPIGSSGGSGAHGSGSSGGAGNIAFCPNMRLFEACGILLDSPCTITVPTVLRLPSHTLLRAHISQHEWLTAATGAFGLSQSTALRLFEVFYQSFMKQDTRLESTRVLLDKLQRSAVASRASGTVEEYVAITNSRTVSLPGFMMFLMAQVLMERPPRALGGEASVDTVLSFLKQHLHDVVVSVTVTKQGAVTQADVTELSFMLREFSNASEAASVGANLGFLWPRSAETVDMAVVANFIRQRLVAPGDVKGNMALSPTTILAVRGITSAVHFVTSAPSISVPSSYVKIQRCLQSSMYITAPLPPTFVCGNANCLIVLGPVAGTLVVDRCEHCQIVATCASLVVSSCKNVTFFVCSNSMPHINTSDVASSEDIRFAPFNTFYPTLEEHLQTSGVNPMLNFGFFGIAGEARLPVDLFSPITVPLAPTTTASVTTRANPCALPPPYAVALAERLQCFNDTSKLLQNSYKQLEAAGRNDLAQSLRTKVHQLFLDWLVDSGQARGLLDLLNYTTVAGAGN